MSELDSSSQPDKYIKVIEIAEHLRVSKMTVYRLLASGERPGIRVGRSFRVPMSALNRYMLSQETTRQEQPAEAATDEA